jgi:hypothetical protein
MIDLRTEAGDLKREQVERAKRRLDPELRKVFDRFAYRLVRASEVYQEWGDVPVYRAWAKKIPRDLTDQQAASEKTWGVTTLEDIFDAARENGVSLKVLWEGAGRDLLSPRKFTPGHVNVYIKNWDDVHWQVDGFERG